MGRHPTQADVARLAAVSRATVSYVINEHSNGARRISPGTRRRVQEAVAQLGYRPNFVAQGLRTQRTHLIAVLVSDLTNPFYPSLIRSAQSVADRAGYDLMVYDADDRADKEAAFIEAVLRRRVDGIILIAQRVDLAQVARLLDAGIRVVGVGPYLRAAGVDTVAIDERQAVGELMSLFIERGHRRIAHLAGPPDSAPGEARLLGYRAALDATGIPFDPALVAYGAFRRGGVAELIQRLLAHAVANPPTALFAANDLMAIEAILTLSRLGYRVPDDIAVCGFDDIPEARLVVPALASVSQNEQALGAGAAACLIERLEDPDLSPEPRRIMVPYTVVLRESVGAHIVAPAPVPTR